MEYSLNQILKKYSEKNEENKYEPVAVGKYGIRKRSEIYKKDLAEDYSKNKVIFKNTLTIGLGTKQIDFGILEEDACYSVSPAYVTFKIDSSIIRPAYLRMYLNVFNDVLSSRYMIASARQGKKVNIDGLLKEKINIPDFAEQDDIIEKFSLFDKVVTEDLNLIEKLTEISKTLFVEKFGNPVQNERNWETDTLKNLTLKIGSGSTPKGGKESYVSAGTSLIRSMNVYDQFFEYKDLAHLTEEQAYQLRGVEIFENDVLINITGASVARSCVVPNEILPARVNQHVSIVRCKQNIINPLFINMLLTNDEFKNKLLSIGEGGGATRQAITKGDLEKLSIICPPKQEQDKFALMIQNIIKTKEKIKKRISLYRELLEKKMSDIFMVGE